MKPRYDFTKGKMISYDGEIIEFAGSSNIDKYEDQIAELMNLFDFKKGEYIVTDETMIMDFKFDAINLKKLNKFKKKYGFSFTDNDKLISIAERMYNLRPF
jgi:hypothetical protein